MIYQVHLNQLILILDIKLQKTVKDYTISNGDYFRYKPDNRANYGSGIFKMNVLIQTSVTTV